MRPSEAFPILPERLARWAHFFDALLPDEAARARSVAFDPAATALDLHARSQAGLAFWLHRAKFVTRLGLAQAAQVEEAERYIAWSRLLRGELAYLTLRHRGDVAARARIDAVRRALALRAPRIAAAHDEAGWVAARLRDLIVPDWDRTRWEAGALERQTALRATIDAVADLLAARRVLTDEVERTRTELEEVARDVRVRWRQAQRLAPPLPDLPIYEEAPRRRRRRTEDAGTTNAEAIDQATDVTVKVTDVTDPDAE